MRRSPSPAPTGSGSRTRSPTSWTSTTTEAVVRVEQLLTSRIALFEKLAARLEPAKLVTAMREWLAGAFRWHAETALPDMAR